MFKRVETNFHFGRSVRGILADEPNIPPLPGTSFSTFLQA